MNTYILSILSHDMCGMDEFNESKLSVHYNRLRNIYVAQKIITYTKSQSPLPSLIDPL